MNRNETIASIKASLKKLFSAETAEVKFSDFVLSDGTKITSTASDLEIGAEVYAVDDMGNQTPVDDGDYVLNDGRTITVAANVITNIAGDGSTEDESPVSDANTANTGDMAEQKMTDGLAENPADEANLAGRVNDLENQLEEILTMLKDLSDKHNTTTEQMMSKIKVIGDEPGDVAVPKTKKGYEEYSSKKINQKRNLAEIEELRSILADKNKFKL